MNKLVQKAYVFPTNTLGKEMKYVPHIYSDEELKRFFYCTDHNCHFSPEVPYRQLVMPLIFRTIYCCGLRPGEATNLKAKDVDLEKGTLTILASKYDPDRIVPLSKSLLSMYLEYAPIVHVDFKSNAPFFPGYHGKPITNNNLNANFRKFLFQASISYGGRGKGPRDVYKRQRSARSRAGDTQALSFTLTPALLIKSCTFLTASSSSRPCFASRWV